MKHLTREQFTKMDAWIEQNARPLEKACWHYRFGHGTKEEIVRQLCLYQNADGGFGNGLEADLQYPGSAAIPSAEAIFLTYRYGLDGTAPRFRALLSYFERSVQDIPKYWEDFPREALEHPHAPWWRYEANPAFSPNPCAAAASALIRYGTETQKELGLRVAKDCLSFLKSAAFCGDHDTLNLMALVEQLLAIDSPLIDEEVIASLKRRILENTCFEPALWREYTFCPLDFVFSPDSLWYDAVKEGIEANLDFWVESLGDDGVWEPNFSWGVDSDVSRRVTENWRGYLAVNRASILAAFGRIELL